MTSDSLLPKTGAWWCAEDMDVVQDRILLRRQTLQYDPGTSGWGELDYDYGSSGTIDDTFCRVASLVDNDDTAHFVDCSYLGTRAFVETDHLEIYVMQTLVGAVGSNAPDTETSTANRTGSGTSVQAGIPYPKIYAQSVEARSRAMTSPHGTGKNNA